MHFAIQIKALPATRTKDARVKAKWGQIEQIIPYNWTLSLKHNALAAAIALRKKYAPGMKFSGMGVLGNSFIITTK